MRLKKMKGTIGPWTTDEILATWRFCNVRRRDDRASQWLLRNVLTEENIEYDLKSFLMFSAWCRWCNWPPTIKAVMDLGFYPKRQIDWVGLGKYVDSQQGKVWTGAYMVRASEVPGQRKGKWISETVVGERFGAFVPELEDRLTALDTYRDIWEVIKGIDGYGSFMAGQIAGDLTYTSLLDDAPDLNTFAPLGPGSIRGFNRVMGVTPLTERPSEELWLEKLAEWRRMIVYKLTSELDSPADYEKITALDVQNCLCETDKYLRAKNGEGRPRAAYVPHNY